MQTKLIILHKEHNLSYKDMGKIVGITPGQYSRKVRGDVPFNQDEMFKISEYFNLSIDEIFLPRKATKRC